MTLGLEDFIITLALNTSCEDTSRIRKQMRIKVSGDTIIEIVTRERASAYAKAIAQVLPDAIMYNEITF